MTGSAHMTLRQAAVRCSALLPPAASSSRLVPSARPLHHSTLLLAKKGGGGPPPPQKPVPQPTGPIRDEKIPASTVRYVDPETNALSAPVALSRLLSSIDRQRYWAVQAKEADASAEGDARFAIVRLVDKKEAYAKEKARVAAKKAAAAEKGGSGVASSSSASAHKEVQLTWSSTSHDASHKLENARQHLVKRGPGARVTVSISSKKGKGAMGGSKASEREDMIRMVDDALVGDTADEAEEGAVKATVRRKGETEWLRNGSAALLQYEVVRAK